MPTRSRAFGVAAVLLATLAVGGCDKHQVAAHACPAVVGKKVIVVNQHGAVGMAKVGLTPRELKAQEKCG